MVVNVAASYWQLCIDLCAIGLALYLIAFQPQGRRHRCSTRAAVVGPCAVAMALAVSSTGHGQAPYHTISQLGLAALGTASLYKPAHRLCIVLNAAAIVGTIASMVGPIIAIDGGSEGESGNAPAMMTRAIAATFVHVWIAVDCMGTRDRQMLKHMLARISPVQSYQLIQSVIKTGKLQDSPVWKLESWYRIETCLDEFEYDTSQRLFVVRAIVRMAWRPYIPIVIIDSLMTLMYYFQVKVRGRMLDCIDNPSEHTLYDVGMTIGLLALLNLVNEQKSRVGILKRAVSSRISKGVETAIFEKPLHISALENDHIYKYGEYHAIKVVDGVIGIYSHVHSLVTALVSLYIVWDILGVHSLIPGVLIIAIFVGARVVRFILDWASRWYILQPYDYIEEICAGISSIKFYAWERKYIEWAKTYVDDPEQDYGAWHRNIRRLVKCLIGIARGSSKELATLVSVVSYSKRNTAPLTAALILQLRQQISDMSEEIQKIFSSMINLRYLAESNRILEMSLRAPRKRTIDLRGVRDRDGVDEPSVALDDCTFAWGKESQCLRNVTLCIEPGDLVVVVGEIGAGKTSLLQAICGEMELVGGTGYMTGTVGYVGQKPWLMNESIRENILMGKEFSEDRYWRVMQVCALLPDIKAMSDGDLTSVGERGISISGGQRARMALARALYLQADIYLLDDLLAAVDPHVERYLIENVVLGDCGGMTSDKTIRILATNSDRVVPYANKVVRVEGGRVSVTLQEPETYTPLASNADIISDIEKEQPTDERSQAIPHGNGTSSDSAALPDDSNRSIRDSMVYFYKICGINVLMAIIITTFAHSAIVHSLHKKLRNAMRTCKEGKNIDSALDVLKIDYRISVIRGVIICFNEAFLAYITKWNSGTKINTHLISSFMRSPLTLFSSIQQSEISSAFYDLGWSVHTSLPVYTKVELSNFMQVCASSYFIPHKVPIFFLIITPTLLLIYKTDSIISRLNRFIEVEKHYAISRYTMERINTIDGVHIARIHKKSKYFLTRFMNSIDKCTLIFRISECTNNIDILVREIFNEIISSATIYAMAVMQHFGVGDIYSIDIDDVRTITRNVLPVFVSILRLRVRLGRYSEFISAYRKYAELPPEAPFIIEGSRPADDWPDKGRIQFDRYNMRYTKEGELALNDVSLAINPGEKVGIVGRTGAGKSSLTKALFRIVEAESGRIVIDDVDISTIGLHDLRSRIGIIPQDPALFNGTVRENLDPLKEHTIEEIWASIIKAQLVDLVNRKEETALAKAAENRTYGEEHENMFKGAMGSRWCWRMLRLGPNSPLLRGGLDKWIDFEGTNFSIGQRQLVSLCRALLKTRKILVLDEATANVDLATDKVMHNVIRREFQDCTVLTIAHRLDTVMECDRILVMDSGRAVEFDTPANLLARDTVFSGLVGSMKH